MVVNDPAFRLGHTEFGMAAAHALDAHQADTLIVEVECAIFDFEAADAKRGGKQMGCAGVRDNDLETIEMRMIKVPELGIAQSC